MTPCTLAYPYSMKPIEAMKTLILPFLLLLAAPVAAQQPALIFESARDLRLAFPDITPEDRYDANGDGIDEIVYLQRDDSGDPELIVIVCVACEEQVVGTIPYTEVVNALGGPEAFPEGRRPRFLGFLDIRGGLPKDAVFRGPESLAIIGILKGKRSQEPFTVPARRLAIIDLNGDGAHELVVGNPRTNTVQVYGAADSGTATEDGIRQALARLTQNYPNPFREATTIAYEVDQSGTVTLEVFDVLGRHIRTLVESEQPAGTYQAQWDGTDQAGGAVAAGTYFYQLRVGAAAVVKQAVVVR